MYTKDKSYNFNPRSPRGERRSLARGRGDDDQYFNPRSPRGERRKGQRKPAPQKQFQSTLPARGATCKGKEDTAAYKFQSTLPARGATFRLSAPPRGAKNFNPRSPRGERPDARLTWTASRPFQSTLPARGATSLVYMVCTSVCISIHAPREGSDR